MRQHPNQNHDTQAVDIDVITRHASYVYRENYARAMTEKIPYDEFGMFHENAEEYGLPFDAAPIIRREFISVSPTRQLSALVWGDSEPEFVFLHGGAQNAHTWDTVMLALQRPGICIDLPGHGHSDSGAQPSLDDLPLAANAADIATVISTLAPRATVVVGMSLGGLTSLAVLRDHPHLVRSLVLVDITPGVNAEKAKAITDFVNGPATFPSFDELLQRTIEFNPTRSVSSLRRGILHNALQLDDGSWVWRHRREDTPALPEIDGKKLSLEPSSLWDTLESTSIPLMLVRGMRSQSVVSDDDENELRTRSPHARIEHVEDAGHSVQGDTPLLLAELLLSFIS
jgi:pimeloyl-ACP methyl ester carboxylesterase